MHTQKAASDIQTNNVLNEIRNLLLGGSVLLSGLLWIPFTNRFPILSLTARIFYFIGILSMLSAVIVLVAPGIQQQFYPDLDVVDRLARIHLISGALFLHTGLLCIVGVIADVVIGKLASAIVVPIYFISMMVIWFGFPRFQCIHHLDKQKESTQNGTDSR